MKSQPCHRPGKWLRGLHHCLSNKEEGWTRLRALHTLTFQETGKWETMMESRSNARALSSMGSELQCFRFAHKTAKKAVKKGQRLRG